MQFKCYYCHGMPEIDVSWHTSQGLQQLMLCNNCLPKFGQETKGSPCMETLRLTPIEATDAAQ